MSASNADEEQPFVWRPKTHVPELDGVRGIAILIVTLYRFSKELPPSDLGNQIAGAMSLGERGVDLFFVLSGFLITGVLLDKRNEAKPIFNFIMRRSLRIFPLYFVAIAGLLAISKFVPGFRGVFKQAADNQFYLWTYLTNVKMSLDDSWCFGALDHFWSLAVEEHFYLVWPFLVLFVVGRKGLRPLLYLTLLTACLCAAARISFALVSENGVAPNVLSIFRFDTLLLGSSVAILARLKTNSLRSWRRPSAVGLAICLLAGGILAITDRKGFTVTHSIWAVVWTCWLVIAISSRTTSLTSRLLRFPILQSLGKYSYAMYVFQSPLVPLVAPIIGVAALGPVVGETAASLIYVPVMCVLSFGAALISWNLLERHMLKLKKYF